MEWINPLNTQLNPICHLLALLGAHHILHFSRIRVNVVQDRSHKSAATNLYTEYFVDEEGSCQLSKKTPA